MIHAPSFSAILDALSTLPDRLPGILKAHGIARLDVAGWTLAALVLLVLCTAARNAIRAAGMRGRLPDKH
jgi:hypothetical protein